MKSEKRIFHIEHLEEDSKEKLGVFSLGDPFKGFKGQIICCNTDVIVAFMWEKLVQKPWKEKKRSDDWKYVIEDWAQSLTKLNRSLTLAGVLYQIQDYTWAEKLYKQSLNISEKLGWRYGISISLHQLAMIQQERGDYEEAEKLYRRSLKIRERIGDQPGITGSLHQLGRIQQLRRDYEEAEKLYNKAWELLVKMGQTQNEKLVRESLYRVRRVRSGLIYRILSALKSKAKKK